MTEDFRELIDEKFKNILDKMNTQHQSTQDRLKNLADQTNKVESRVDEISKTIQNIIITDAQHYSSCRNTISDIPGLHKKIEVIKDDLEGQIEKVKDDIDKDYATVKFYLKNPKIFIGVIAASVLFLFFAYIEAYSRIVDVDNRLAKKEYYYRDPNEQSVFRGGETKPITPIKKEEVKK